ncbi:unnamed protein product, partial [Coregonus sp. 'balchen']
MDTKLRGVAVTTITEPADMTFLPLLSSPLLASLQGIFLVYDITSERSFQHIMKWASDVDEYAPDNIQKILIGNKSDEEEKRQVATEQGNKLAKDYGMDFFETSAFTNHNITESFKRLAEQVLSANKKDLDLLRASVTDELNLAALEEEEGITDGADASQKGC